MRRLWPMAETACSVAVSGAWARVMFSAGSPAAMAPLVTRTTRCPSVRAAATSSHSLATDATSITPRSSVMDEVPIFTTTVDTALLVVVEDHAADADPVPRLGAGAGEGAVDAHPLQPVVDE